MKKNWISKLAAIAFLAFATVQVHAFVNTGETAAVVEDTQSLFTQIEGIAAQIADEALSSEEATAKINESIDQIDELLDGEPANEGELLDLRDALVDMRLELSSADVSEEQTVGACASCGGGAVSTGPVLGGGPIFSGGGGGFASGGGGIAIGGGGGGGLIGFATSPLGIAAIAGTIVAVTAGGDDDDDVASM